MSSPNPSFTQSIANYFAEFKILKTVSKDFWLVNAMHFFEVLGYFSMATIITLYLTDNAGFSDIDSGKWYSYYGLFVIAFMFAVGSICDVIGIKKTLYIGLLFLLVGYLGLTTGPVLFEIETGQLIVIVSIIMLALGMGFLAPPIKAALRRFTTKQNRATGFNMYYVIMNVGAVIANVVLVEFFRSKFGPVEGNLWAMGVACICILIAIILTGFINENNYAEESERLEATETRRPLAIFKEVWNERAFQKLLLFLFITIGVKLIFTHQHLVMPKYYTRVLNSDFELGYASAINPSLITLGVLLVIPILNRYSTVKLLIVGMSISAASLFIICIPPQWLTHLPFIETLSGAYLFAIIIQIVLFALGETIFNPRFSEYAASVAPKDKVASYMALAALPMFIAKPINGFISGILITYYCYDGIRAKIDTGNITYSDSPEFMWVIYTILAVLSPLAVISLRRFFEDHSAAATAAKGSEQAN